MRLHLAAATLLTLSCLSLPANAQTSAPAPFDSSEEPRTADEAQESQNAWGKFLKRKVVGKNSIGMEFALIPPGKFPMGSPASEDRGPFTKAAEEVQHVVKITRPFYFGMHEVTRAQVKEVTGEVARWDLGDIDTSDFPVAWISTEEIQDFLEKLSKRDKRTYRLPTEAEWEYACRAGTHTVFWCGPTLDGTQANYAFESSKEGKPYEYPNPCKVGSYAPNPFGLHDVYGNVCERCSDWYDASYYAKSPDTDPPGPDQPDADKNSVARGGGCHAGVEMQRSAARWRENSRNTQVGFRVVMELPAELLAKVPVPAEPLQVAVAPRTKKAEPKTEPKTESKAKPTAKKDPKGTPPANLEGQTELEGDWELVEARSGETVLDGDWENVRYEFRGSKEAIVFQTGTLEHKIKIDSSKKPNHIDASLSLEDGTSIPPDFGIYELKGNCLRMSMAEGGDDRPKDFSGSGALIVLLRRLTDADGKPVAEACDPKKTWTSDKPDETK